MSDYADRFRNNEAIDRGGNTGPKFPGRRVAFNGQTGKMALVAEGQKLEEAQEIQSLMFATDFTMRRLKYTQGSEMSATSTYIVDGDKYGSYRLTVQNKTYVGRTKKEVADQMQLNSGEHLAMEEIYIGYMLNLNGESCTSAEPVWFVNRGVNAYLLNQEFDVLPGGIKMQTVIGAFANGTTRKNNSGGMNFVMDFNVFNMSDDKIEPFIEWVQKDGSDDKVAEFKQEMLSAKPMPVQSATEDAFGSGAPLPDEPLEIQDDDLPF